LNQKSLRRNGGGIFRHNAFALLAGFKDPLPVQPTAGLSLSKKPFLTS
jgi:hypothetical protein